MKVATRLCYDRAMTKPYLIAMSGLPGSGKSTIAERLAEQLRIPVFSVDPIESAMLKAGIAQSFETGLAAYLVAEVLASEQLKLGISVIIDAVNAEEEGKDVWRGLAHRHGLTLTILEVVVSDEALHQGRLESRVRNLHGFGEVTWERVEARRASSTEWKEPTLRVDSTHDIEANVSEALRFIQARRS
ncbi:MAG TPA: AAA family ATPase [Ktedonobacterales bacterium]|nr:AAA family ATPase [Ktedonobacterales bacterium]